MAIIGLSGYARSGKDSAAEVLERFGFVRIAFADKLREFMYVMNPRITYEGINITRPLQDIIDKYGWDGYKETNWANDIRRWMQLVGTECVRGVLGPDTWLNATLDSLDYSKNYVITDVRFPNEADRIRSISGGNVIRISRDSVHPAQGHISEIALDNYTFDGVWDNNGTLEDLDRMVRMHFPRYLG